MEVAFTIPAILGWLVLGYLAYGAPVMLWCILIAGRYISPRRDVPNTLRYAAHWHTLVAWVFWPTMLWVTIDMIRKYGWKR